MCTSKFVGGKATKNEECPQIWLVDINSHANDIHHHPLISKQRNQTHPERTASMSPFEPQDGGPFLIHPADRPCCAAASAECKTQSGLRPDSSPGPKPCMLARRLCSVIPTENASIGEFPQEQTCPTTTLWETAVIAGCVLLPLLA